MKKLNETVRISQGFDKFTEGRVISYDSTTKNRLGLVGNYEIEITGGVDCFGKPAKVGTIKTVHESNII